MVRFLVSSIAIVVFLFSGLSAFAVMWENYFEAKTKDSSAKVEIDRHSVKSQFMKDGKIVTFRLRYRSYSPNEHVKAINNYRIDCSSQDAFITRSDYKIYKDNKLVSKTSNVEEKQLSGKEYEDIKGIMQELCE